MNRRQKTQAKYEKVKARSRAAIEANERHHEDPHGGLQAMQQKPKPEEKK